MTQTEGKPQGNTQMTNPPESHTKMVAPKRVRIEALTEINVLGKTLKAGDKALVSEEEAEEFCKPYKNLGYAFGGERSDHDAPRHEFVRAKRVE